MKHKLKMWIMRYFAPGFIELMVLIYVEIKNIGRKGEGLAAFKPEETNSLLILGNGPSLKDSVALQEREMKTHKLMCVNQFATSKLYERLMPEYYVLADAEYWEPSTELISEWVQALLRSIQEKTTWKMTMFLSEEAKGSQLESVLSEMENIRLVYYSNVDDRFDVLKRESWIRLLKQDKIAPPGQTVLNVCMSIGIYYGFNEIYLVGADSSWHEQYYVDQKTNDLYTEDRHFYGTERILECRYSPEHSNIGNEFRMIAEVMDLYQMLKEYGLQKGTKIYNASKFSWIDVFDRKDL